MQTFTFTFSQSHTVPHLLLCISKIFLKTQFVLLESACSMYPVTSDSPVMPEERGGTFEIRDSAMKIHQQLCFKAHENSCADSVGNKGQ